MNKFEREQASLEILSPYQKLHVRRKAKRPRPGKRFNKVPFTSKNMGTMWKKERVWVMIDLLQLQMKNAWCVYKVHSYYSFLQGPIMKAYIEENQARRIVSRSAVTIKLMKDANNKALMRYWSRSWTWLSLLIATVTTPPCLEYVRDGPGWCIDTYT